MKAVIIEICRGYCIVMTEDGQFLKQKIPQGIFEIGDEIMVDEGYDFKPEPVNIKAKLFKNFAVAASVLIIVVIGSIFSVWYLRHNYPPGDEVTEYVITGEKMIGEEAPAPADTAEEERKEEAAEESALAMAAEEVKAIYFYKLFSIEEQPGADENISDVISFSYKVIDGIILEIEINNISSTLSFTGTFKLVTLLSDEEISQTKIIRLEEFRPGKLEKEQLFLKTGVTELRLEIEGNAY